MTYAGHRDQRWGCTSYAQHGDDFMLINLFELIGIERPSYLDLGAHHPITISNTYLLYLRGSRGVNVEANPALMAAFEAERPEDANVNVGVGVRAGHATFYMHGEKSGLNTFSLAEALKWPDASATPTLPVMTLGAIVVRYCLGRFPNILLCDIEGLDFDVLLSANFSDSYPLVICVETRKHESARMIDMLRLKRFSFYCRLGENLFFVHETVEARVFS